jgi:hypothetical protein
MQKRYVWSHAAAAVALVAWLAAACSGNHRSNGGGQGNFTANETARTDTNYTPAFQEARQGHAATSLGRWTIKVRDLVPAARDNEYHIVEIVRVGNAYFDIITNVSNGKLNTKVETHDLDCTEGADGIDLTIAGSQNSYRLKDGKLRLFDGNGEYTDDMIIEKP